jgi:hypothetical protein
MWSGRALRSAQSMCTCLCAWTANPSYCKVVAQHQIRIFPHHPPPPLLIPSSLLKLPHCHHLQHHCPHPLRFPPPTTLPHLPHALSAQPPFIPPTIPTHHTHPRRFLESGGVFKLEFGPKAFIVVSDPVVVRHLLKDNAFNYDKGVLAEILEPIMGKGLIPADLETWKVGGWTARVVQGRWCRAGCAGQGVQGRVCRAVVQGRVSRAGGAWQVVQGR